MKRFLLVGLVLILTACGEQETVIRVSGDTMGTTYSIIAVDDTNTIDMADVKSAAERALAEVNAQMSNWDPTSEVSRFNAQSTTDPFPISSGFYEVMTRANQVHRDSSGQFDVTLGPLIELWGFGAPSPDNPVPSDEEIAAARAQIGQARVLEVSDQPTSLRKIQPETSVYLAAIAKGYGADRIAANLEGLGLDNYMVEIGGDLIASGKNPNGDAWRIGIERPDAGLRTVEEVVAVADLGLATSGDYRNYFEQDGVRYSHIIDAQTGRPVTHKTASVTVLAETAMEADAWATALLVIGQERGIALSESQDLAVMFINRSDDPADNGFEIITNARFEALQAEHRVTETEAVSTN